MVNLITSLISGFLALSYFSQDKNVEGLLVLITGLLVQILNELQERKCK